MRDSRNLAEIFCYAIICSGVFSDRWEFDNMILTLDLDLDRPWPSLLNFL